MKRRKSGGDRDKNKKQKKGKGVYSDKKEGLGGVGGNN